MADPAGAGRHAGPGRLALPRPHGWLVNERVRLMVTGDGARGAATRIEPAADTHPLPAQRAGAHQRHDPRR